MRTGRKTVLFVSHSSRLYGADRSLLTLVSGLRSGGRIEPVVIMPDEGALADMMRASGVRVISCGRLRYYPWIRQKRNLAKALARLAMSLATLALLFRELRRIKPDAVYSNTLATPFGALISELLRVPHVWHAREFVHEDMKAEYDFGTQFSMALLDRSSRVVCNSFAVKDKLASHVRKEKFEVIYNGFEFPRLQEDAKDRYDRYVQEANPARLLIIGSVQPSKGQEEAVRALSELTARGYCVRLSIAGSGDEEYIAYLKRLTEELSLRERVIWHGFVGDTASLLSDSAIVFVCSRAEAFGRVAVEALASQIPVVGASSGGLPEIIEHEVTGLLYRPGDHAGLADQAERLIEDCVLYENVARYGRESVIAKFNVSQYVYSIQSVVEQVSEPRQARVTSNLEGRAGR